MPAAPFFTFTPEMLSLDPAGCSTKWYEDFFTSLNWRGAVRNSVIIAFFATILATTLGTVAALGLSRPQMPCRTAVVAILISPMIVPMIIAAAGMYFFSSKIGLASPHLGVILAHAALELLRRRNERLRGIRPTGSPACRGFSAAPAPSS